jgi:hypothetical protein
MIGIAVFGALCRKVVEEKDPTQIELLKERMRKLLTDTHPVARGKAKRKLEISR